MLICGACGQSSSPQKGARGSRPWTQFLPLSNGRHHKSPSGQWAAGRKAESQDYNKSICCPLHKLRKAPSPLFEWKQPHNCSWASGWHLWANEKKKNTPFLNKYSLVGLQSTGWQVAHSPDFSPYLPSWLGVLCGTDPVPPSTGAQSPATPYPDPNVGTGWW